MALTQAQRARIKNHLGYVPTATVLDAYLNQVAGEQEVIVLDILTQMDAIWTQIKGAISRLKVLKVGEITINNHETGQLNYSEYVGWGTRLGQAVGYGPNMSVWPYNSTSASVRIMF